MPTQFPTFGLFKRESSPVKNKNQKRVAVKIYLVSEILSRELLGNLLLGAVLASRGHIAVILHQEDSFMLSSSSVSGTTFFHTKSLHYAQERLSHHRKLAASGFLITSQDQETFFAHRDYASRVSERFCEENLNIAVRVYLWSKKEAEEVGNQFPEQMSKLRVLGSPREDIWSRQFRAITSKKSPARKRILIVPSVGGANNRMRHWELMSLRKSVLGPRSSARVFDVMVEDLVDGLRSQLFMSRVALALADEFPKCDVVIQPKKNEVLDSWTQSLNAVDKRDGRRENLFIDATTFLEESIHGADVVINSNSTAGMMALVGEVPLISIGPTFSLASKIGCQVEREDEVLMAVRTALQNPEEFIAEYKEDSYASLGDRIKPRSQALSAEAIVRDLESLDQSKARSKLTLADWILILGPGSVRRFLSIAWSILRLRRIRRASPEAVETVSQKKVDELLDAISEAANIEFRPSARVLGRRNIILQPRNHPSRQKSRKYL